jgi:hypothetical protein
MLNNRGISLRIIAPDDSVLGVRAGTARERPHRWDGWTVGWLDIKQSRRTGDQRTARLERAFGSGGRSGQARLMVFEKESSGGWKLL